MRCLILQEDVAPDDTAHISDGVEQHHADRSFPARGEIVTDPCETCVDGGVGARWDGEEEGVGQAGEFWVGDGEEACVLLGG